MNLNDINISIINMDCTPDFINDEIEFKLGYEA